MNEQVLGLLTQKNKLLSEININRSELEALRANGIQSIKDAARIGILMDIIESKESLIRDIENVLETYNQRLKKLEKE